MTVDLFAGIPVRDYTAGAVWYERLLGGPPSFLPNDIEAVWELADHRYLYIRVEPEHAGHAMHTVFVSDFDARIVQILQRGLEPAERETYATASARSPSATRTATRSRSAVPQPDPPRSRRRQLPAIRPSPRPSHPCRSTAPFVIHTPQLEDHRYVARTETPAHPAARPSAHFQSSPTTSAPVTALTSPGVAIMAHVESAAQD
jgi:hypothetical protein